MDCLGPGRPKGHRLWHDARRRGESSGPHQDRSSFVAHPSCSAARRGNLRNAMMLEFPYMQLPGSITRPIVAIVIEGPSGRRLLDGLLDTGSDRTIFPRREAAAIGISLPAR